MEGFERETWAQLLQCLACRDEAGQHPISVHQPVNAQGCLAEGCQQPSHKCPYLHAGILLHEGAQGTTEVLQKGLGKQEMHPGLHLEHAQQLEGSRGCYQGAEKCLPPRAHPCPQGWPARRALSVGLSACTARMCPVALIRELR